MVYAENALATFQRDVDVILSSVTLELVLVYLDDMFFALNTVHDYITPPNVYECYFEKPAWRSK